jgi:hypothetical protein
VTPTITGIAVAATLTLTWITLGFGFFVLVTLAMAVGALVGRIVEGKLDATSILDALRGKRSSS